MIKKSLFLLLYTSQFFIVDLNASEKLDVMVDFAYPLSIIESVRYAVSQAVFSLQHGQESSAISFLEEAIPPLQSRQKVTDDDRDFLESMLDQINALIDALEKDQNKSMLVRLSQEIANEL